MNKVSKIILGLIIVCGINLSAAPIPMGPISTPEVTIGTVTLTETNGTLSVSTGTNEPVASLKAGDSITNLVNDIGYITDAPSDGTQYVRQDSGWTVAAGGDVYLASNQTFTGENTFSGGTWFGDSLFFNNLGVSSFYFEGGIVGRFDPSDVTFRDVTSKITVSSNERKLYSSAGVGNGTVVLDWENLQTYDNSSNTSLDWQNRYTFDSYSTSSIDWQNRALYDFSGSDISIEWGNRRLHGDWEIGLDFVHSIPEGGESSSKWNYWAAGGVKDAEGSWRQGIVGSNMVFQVYMNGGWSNSVEFVRP